MPRDKWLKSVRFKLLEGSDGPSLSAVAVFEGDPNPLTIVGKPAAVLLRSVDQMVGHAALPEEIPPPTDLALVPIGHLAQEICSRYKVCVITGITFDDELAFVARPDLLTVSGLLHRVGPMLDMGKFDQFMNQKGNIPDISSDTDGDEEAADAS